MADKTATYIEIRYSDGSVDKATGNVARKIWEWYLAAEVMKCIHGARYYGPKFTRTVGLTGDEHA